MHINDRRKQRLANLWLKFAPLKTRQGVYVARKSVLGRDMMIGRGTRINGPTCVRGAGALRIGCWCAIGHLSRFITTNHAMTGVNLQFRLHRRLGLAPQIGSRTDIVIGHNVWIGDGAMIMPGVNIGNGAVIGAGAVVTRDIEPYVVCGGNPARKIRDRFDDRVKEALDASAWWHWPMDRLHDARTLFEADLSTMSADEAIALIANVVKTQTDDVS